MPDGTIVPLNKFASMGSALCFPIEAMVFFTIIMYALVKKSGRVPSRRLLVKLASDVAVYGDDIIVPGSMAPVVMESLEDFGLRVNHDKSFSTGLFRESCGGDYYAGVDITPVYVRQWDDTGTLSEASHRLAYVSLSNQFYSKGMWHACQYLREHIDKTVGPLPYARSPLGVLHHASFVRDTHLRWDRHVCGYRVKGVGFKSRRWDDRPENLDGHMLLSFGRRGLNTSLANRRYSYAQQGPHWDVYRDIFQPDQSRPIPTATSSEDRANLGPSGLLPQPSCELESTPYFSSHSGRWTWSKNHALSYAELAEQGSKVDLMRHLVVASGVDHEQSERPYALCQKRKWTASPAGLTW